MYDIRYMDNDAIEEYQALAKDLWELREKEESASDVTSTPRTSEGFDEASE